MSRKDSKHLIKRYTFDVELENKEDAHRLQNELSRIFNQHLVKLLDKILTEVDQPEFITKFKSIELDLGEIYEPYLEHEIVAKMEHLLRRKMKEMMVDISHRQPGQNEMGERIPLAPASRTVLEHFLTKGVLPASASLLDAPVEELFRQQLISHPAEMRTMLRKIASSNRNVAARIALQFSDSIIQTMYRTFFSAEDMYLMQQERELSQELEAISGKSKYRIREEIRESIINYLLNTSASVFSRKEFRKAMRPVITGRYGKKAAKLFPQEEETATKPEANPILRQHVAQLNRYLANPTASGITKGELARVLMSLMARDPEAIKDAIRKSDVSLEQVETMLEVLQVSEVRRLLMEMGAISGDRMVRLAAALIASHASYETATAEAEKFQRRVYTSMIKYISRNVSLNLDPTRLLQKVREESEEVLTSTSRKRLEAWEPEELIQMAEEGDVMEAARREKAIRDAKEAATAESARKGNLEGRESSDTEEGDEVELDEFGRPLKRRVRDLSSEFPEQLGYEDNEGASVLARVDYVLYVLAEGKEPWWANVLPERQLAIVVKELVEQFPEEFLPAIKTYFSSLNPEQAKKVTWRMLAEIPESVMIPFIEVLMPGMAGFMATGAQALQRFRAEEEGLNVPSEMTSDFAFGWAAALQYAILYHNTNPGAGAYLKFMLKEQAAALGMVPRVLVRRMNAIARNAVKAGEARYVPLDNMLPDEDDSLELEAPLKPQDLSSAEQIRRFREAAGIQEDETWIMGPEGKLVLRESLSPEELATLVEAEEAAKAERRKKSADSSTDPAGKERKDSEESETLTPAEQEQRELEQKALEAREKAIQKEREEAEAERLRMEEELKAASLDLSELTEAERMLLADDDLLESDDAAGDLITSLDPEQLAALEAAEQDSPEQRRRRDLAKEFGEDEPESGADDLPLQGLSAALEVIQHYLLHGSIPASAGALSKAEVVELITGVIATQPRQWTELVKRLLPRPNVQERIVELGFEVVQRTLGITSTSMAQEMLPFIEGIERMMSGSGAPMKPGSGLVFALVYNLVLGKTSFKPFEFVSKYLVYLATNHNKRYEPTIDFMLDKAKDQSFPAKLAMTESLESIRESMRSMPVHPDDRKDREEDMAPTIEEDEDIYVDYGGLVLVWPFLNFLFEQLGYITPLRQWKGSEEQIRAVHLLYYVAWKREEAKEHDLAMTKLLCGFPITAPTRTKVELTDNEKEWAEKMLGAIGQQWKALKSITNDSLRGTFIIREGVISLASSENYLVKVENKPYDMLLDKMPWAVSQIRLPWLSYLIQVDWR